MIIAVLVIYLILLYMKYKKKDNSKISGILLMVQGILWLMMAIDRWGAAHMVIRAAYIIVIVLSVASGIRELYKQK